MLRNARMLAVVLLVAGMGLAGCAEDENPKDTAPTLSVRPSSSAPESASATASESKAASESASGTATVTASPGRSSATGADPVDVGRPPTTYAEARAHVAAVGGTAQQKKVFRTADDIYCVLDHDVLDPACEAPQGGGTRDLRACGNAESDVVGRIELAARGAVPLCNTDTIRESMPAPVPVPALIVNPASGVKCAVEAIGVTCIDPGTKAGFFLTKGSYRVF